MKQLLILSGKGGTGKTTVAGAFIRLFEAKACADCDVDAPNLHLILEHGGVEERKDYYGLPKACIDEDICTMCGLCSDMCRFDAVNVEDTTTINQFACEGCGLCEVICPFNAIEMIPTVAGDIRIYDNHEKGVFTTGQLRIGNGTSGLLVTQVKGNMIESSGDAELAIIDGSPGIGCPVIASISGVDMVLIVAEPSISGLSDMERILDTARGLKARSVVCVNKADLNTRLTERIIVRCKERGIPYVGQIPYDPEAVNALNRGLTLADVECPAGDAVKVIFEKVADLL
ncbi:MAG TPA: ATP-binding protein [Candidatus Methanomethylophilaceae archaeon]|nr:ATP-binding protein [Candidatus Methanomethylophilaceae archaeon]